MNTARTKHVISSPRSSLHSHINHHQCRQSAGILINVSVQRDCLCKKSCGLVGLLVAWLSCATVGCVVCVLAKVCAQGRYILFPLIYFSLLPRRRIFIETPENVKHTVLSILDYQGIFFYLTQDYKVTRFRCNIYNNTRRLSHRRFRKIIYIIYISVINYYRFKIPQYTCWEKIKEKNHKRE